MLRRIEQFFNKYAREPEQQEQPSEHKLQLATAALLIEVTRADFQVGDAERDAVLEGLSRLFDLTDDEIKALRDLAEEESGQSVSLHPFVGLLNKHYSMDQKAKVLETLWHVVYADGRKDKYEESLVRKIAELLYVPQGVFTRTRHDVEAELGIASA